MLFLNNFTKFNEMPTFHKLKVVTYVGISCVVTRVFF